MQQSSFKDVPINVKNTPFMAKGDGSSDDTVAIKLAISYAARQGGTVYFPAGTYCISQPLAWIASNVYLQGDGGAVILPTHNFAGDALIRIGTTSKALNPTYSGGIVDLAVCTAGGSTDLVGVKLIQTWFTHISQLSISNYKGLGQVQQTALQICSGAEEDSPNLANWAGNINIYDLQISGSFKTCISHISGCQNPVKAQVNGVNYFGGFAFGAGKDRSGSIGMDLQTGDSTRVYGLALEDFETGCFIGTQNQGPFDFRMEDCTTPFKFAPGITATAPQLVTLS
jgi:hypothetical protein